MARFSTARRDTIPTPECFNAGRRGWSGSPPLRASAHGDGTGFPPLRAPAQGVAPCPRVACRHAALPARYAPVSGKEEGGWRGEGSGVGWAWARVQVPHPRAHQHSVAGHVPHLRVVLQGGVGGQGGIGAEAGHPQP